MSRKRRIWFAAAAAVLSALVMATASNGYGTQQDTPLGRYERQAKACRQQSHPGRVAFASGEESICFYGLIDPASARQFMNIKIGRGDRLFMNSVGGDVEAGLAIARSVLKSDMNVVVDGICLSSCANYLFLAGRTKTVLPFALVGFHGGPSAEGEINYVGPEGGRAKARDAFKNWIVTILKKQAEFFTAVHVDERLIYSPPSGSGLRREDQHDRFWVYGSTVLASRFGVSGVLDYSGLDQWSTFQRTRSKLLGFDCRGVGFEAWICRPGLLLGLFNGIPGANKAA